MTLLRIFRSLLLFSCVLFVAPVFGQRLNFTHYSLDEGLIQSQASGLAQDRYNHLWISTFGGANRFDGLNFTPFTADHGLENISLNTAKVGPDGKAWFGSSAGLTCIDGQKLTNYGFTLKSQLNLVVQIAFSDQKIWALSGGQLFQLANGKLQQVKIPAQNNFITHIETNHKGQLFVSILNLGILKREGTTWKIYIPLKEKMYIAKFGFDSNDNCYFTSKNRLFESRGNTYQQIDKEILDRLPFNFACIISDGNGGYWIGASEGAVHISNHKVSIYNEANGYTNNHTSAIFKDAEQNIWFATNGDGLYKLNPTGFSLIDRSLGLPNSVTGIAKAKDGTFWFGTVNDGIFKFERNKAISVKIPTGNADSKKINSVFFDSKDNLFITTFYGGLWRYQNAKFEQLYPIRPTDPALTFGMAEEDELHRVWITSNYGMFIYADGKLGKIPNFSESCIALVLLENRQALVVTLDGVKLFKDEKLDASFHLPKFTKSNILCIQKLGNYIYLGTDNIGIIVLNLTTKKHRVISAKDGLFSNNIYSLAVINHQLWAGTGLGINRFQVGKTPGDLKLLASEENLIAECNQYAFLQDDGKAYFGTSKGVLVFDAFKPQVQHLKPIIAIQQVIFGSEIKTAYQNSSGYSLPSNLKLPHDQNTISFKFQGISLKDAKHVKYTYTLKGLSEKVNANQLNTLVNYADLPPGKYTFMVKALFQEQYETTYASFSFEVLPAFYQTHLFQILLFCSVLLGIYGVYRFKLDQQRRKNLHERIVRSQEQEKIRKQTAEDLHDDFGNKLTRINMISELLDKLTPNDNADLKSLIQQIRFTATEMYAGTKDLLWTLNPQNDKLSAVLLQVKKIIVDTIKHSKVNFSDISIDTDYLDMNLPLGYSRNIILISKELTTNIIKHSKAKTLTFNVEMPSPTQYVLTFTDDGIGFDLTQTITGHGLQNMQNRATKLNGKIEYFTEKGKGLKIVLTFTIPQN